MEYSVSCVQSTNQKCWADASAVGYSKANLKIRYWVEVGAETTIDGSEMEAINSAEELQLDIILIKLRMLESVDRTLYQQDYLPAMINR